MRCSPQPLVPVLGGLVATLVCACGSNSAALDTRVVERAIAGSIQSERHVHARVACPSNIPRRAGLVFTCTARLQVGAYPVPVTQTNASGHVSYRNEAPLVVLDIAKVQAAIARSISAQRHLSAVVTCPAEVLQQTGIVFSCRSQVGSRSYRFEVVELDGSGHVRYVGR